MPSAPVPVPRRARLRRRLAFGVVVVLSALGLTLPAVASSGEWPVWGQSQGNSRQALVAGPSDPGMLWAVDLGQITTDAAPDGYAGAGSAGIYDPILDPAGNVLQVAANPAVEGRAALVALDPQDGSVAWEAQRLNDRCGPAVDAQGRVWASMRADASDATSSPHLQAFSSDGTPLADTLFELTTLGTSSIVNWCPQNTSLHVVGPAEAQRLVLFLRERTTWSMTGLDISGDTPEVLWNTRDDDALALPGQVVSGSLGGDDGGSSPLLAAATDDELLVVLFDEGALSLARIDLDTGEVAHTIDLPMLDADGDPVVVATARIGAQILVDGQRAVVSLNDRGRIPGQLLGVDLGSNATSPDWNTPLPTSNRNTPNGPAVLALTGSTVLAEAEGLLYGVELSDGSLQDWSGELGAQAAPLVADAAGAAFLAAPAGAGEVDLVRYDEGRTTWRVRRIDLTVGNDPATTDPVSAATITEDGALVARVGSRLFAIDDSGGLGECVLPFEDVSDTNTHAVNICRLVELGITGGTTPTTYGPSGPVTRAQMASFLARSLDLAPIDDPGADAFPDVNPDNVHAGTINAIRAAGITQGLQDGTYNPSGTVTRAQMASFLANAAGLEPVVGGSGFADVDPNNVHTPNIYAVRDAGITGGVTPTTYNPTGNVRRDQMASFIIRMVDYLDDQG